MGAHSGPELDLLGQPYQPPRDPRGRKSYKRDEQVAKIVADLRADGQALEDIAAVINLSVPTLKRIYSRELDGGAQLLRARMLQLQRQAAEAGKVSAINAVLKRLDGDDGARKSRRPVSQSPQKLGKKQSAVVDAHQAHKGTSWESALKPH